jgi:hypothetical protein
MWPTHYIPNQPRVDGTPPPRYYFTTPPYPAEATESFLSDSASFMGGLFGVGDDEEFRSAAAFVSGFMEQKGYVEVEAEDEIRSQAWFHVGVMEQYAYELIEAGDEFTSAAVFVSGDMRDPLVRYENWPLGADTEDLLSAAAFVSGVLT